MDEASDEPIGDPVVVEERSTPTKPIPWMLYAKFAGIGFLIIILLIIIYIASRSRRDEE